MKSAPSMECIDKEILSEALNVKQRKNDPSRERESEWAWMWNVNCGEYEMQANGFKFFINT